MQVLTLDIYNGSTTQVESYRHITGVSTPLLKNARNRDGYAGGRLEDILVIDQEGTVRYWTNSLSVDVDYNKINQMVDALINKSAYITLSLRSLYFGTKLEVGQSKTTTMNIVNTGDGPLDITGYSAPEGITMEPPTLSVGANETQAVQITLTPTRPGTFTGGFKLDHNGNGVATLLVPILNLTIEGQPVEIPADPRADFDGSGAVDFPDFLSFVRVFGTVDSTFDLDGSNQVDFGDFLIFVQSFGKSLN